MKRRQKRKHLEIEESEETDEKSGGTRKSQDSSKTTFPLDLVPERDATNATSQRPFSSCPSYKTCVSSLCTDKDDKGMKIYYMQVQMKKGMVVSWDTKETSESLEKHPRMEEATLPDGVWVGTPPSDVSTRNPLSDSEPSGEEKENEEKPESDSPPGSPMIEERPRAKTPDLLVTMENGFRCMACCRGFATIESLQEHVQYGIRDGFSCHVFHLTMAQIIGNVASESTRKEERNSNKEKEKHKEKKTEEQQPTEGSGTKRPWSQCPGWMFDSPKDRRRRKDHEDSRGSRHNDNSVKENEKTNTQSNT